MRRIRTTLYDTVRGQDEALKRVIDAILVARHRVVTLIDESERMPAIVLALVGPTGVGKTLLARTIALAVTGSEENLKRFDMAEFQREHSDQRLIGSPPGYVGHLEGGQLTNWVLEKPCSVVLIDEWEKGADRIQDIWLQVLSGARLTDGKGQTVDFSNVILIFTSNIGGSESRQQSIGPDTPYPEVEKHFKEQVQQYFAEDLDRPEIFGRVKHGVVVFNYIGSKTAREAVVKRLKRLTEGIEKRFEPHVRFAFEPNNADPPNDDQIVVNELLAISGYHDFGLRDVNNVIRERVGGSLGEKMEVLAARIALQQTGFRARFHWDAENKKVEVLI
jgi:ATP-dependent Clp protease ATP-binding subunit ClpA